MCNVKYTFSENGSIAYGHLPDGIVFMVDTSSLVIIKHLKKLFRRGMWEWLVCSGITEDMTRWKKSLRG